MDAARLSTECLKNPFSKKQSIFLYLYQHKAMVIQEQIEKNVENFCLSSLSLVTLGETKGNALGSFIPNQCL